MILLNENITVKDIDEYIKDHPHLNQLDVFNTLLFNSQDVEVINYLLENGADVNYQNKDGNTPLFFVKHTEIAKLFLLYGADVNIKNNDGKTALFHCGNLYICRLLIRHGANVNHPDNYGRTPIFYCYDRYKAKFMINNGANIFILDNDGRNALSDSFHEVSELLIDFGLMPTTIHSYKRNRELFNEEIQTMFDVFITLTDCDVDFFAMCLAYQESMKNNDKMNVKDMEIL